MALKKCKECDKSVSTKAKACPNCGYDMTESEASKKAKGCLGLIILCALVGWWASTWELPEAQPWNETNNWSAAYTMMEGYVEDRLVSPGTAEFPGVFDGMKDHITKNGTTYTINSWVDSQNRMGGTVRTYFVGKIRQVDDDTWQLVELKLKE